MCERPDRLFSTCSFGVDGGVEATGFGVGDPFDSFTISANGVLVDMVVVEIDRDRRWHAIDQASLPRWLEARRSEREQE